MTREEAIKILKEIIEEGWLISDFDKCTAIDACEMAIKALKQEPCENAIGRSDMLDAIGHGTTYTSKELQRIIKDLPPVNPQPKTGQWIDVFGGCECSECGCLEGGYSDYCPNCGRSMIEPQ